jgi:hypothetical protein
MRIRNGRSSPRFAPLLLELAHAPLHGDRHHHAGLGVFLDALRLRVAEEEQHGIADVFVDRGTVFERDARHLREIVVEDAGQLLRFEIVGGLGERGDVGEKDRELLALRRDLDILRAAEDRFVDLGREVFRKLRREPLQHAILLDDERVDLLDALVGGEQRLLRALLLRNVGDHGHHPAGLD